MVRPWRRDRVTFGLDWKAEAEYGGYYQAVATGIYAKHGLEVTIRQGGPQVNQTQLLLAGKLDFNIASNSYLALNLAQENLPFPAVAAMFQKDPSVLLAHPGQGNDSFEALKGKPIMIGADTRAGWWNFLRAKFGYTDAQIRPYTFNLAPFLADKAAIQQGYLGSEPYAIKQQAEFRPGGAAARRCRVQRLWQPDHHQRQADRRRTPTWCSASSMRRSRAGTPTSMATRRRPTR